MDDSALIDLLRMTPTIDRNRILDQECAGNSERRARIEAILQTAANDESNAAESDNPSESISAKSSPGASDDRAVTDDYQSDRTAPADVIAGRYELIEKLGEGGMGEVWVARQTEPVKRRVAVKLIKAGMDSRSVVHRFDQERQALAMMDHPNIARVLDGGMTEDRRPFFVMELVNGLPLTKFCDEVKLPIRERLELFLAICGAIQHAHQKGIVHRDLKPANILITVIDGRPVAKVIDFGVAKALGGKLIDDSVETQFGGVVGTLEYMSPEQAGYAGVDVDTRADVYSLGVILYELLTGVRPLERAQMKKAAVDEMIRMVRELEPSKPSTRLSTEARLPSLAASRRVEPARLTRLLRGELDWVIMKCLEKQRDRRYQTVNDLGRDLQRYLSDEMVEARPPSTGYRLRKFIRRNRGQVIAAGLVLCCLITGVIGTSLAMLTAQEARRAEAAERRNAELKEQEAVTERNNAVREREAAEKARDQEAKSRAVTAEQRRLALDTVRDVLFRVDNAMRNNVRLAPVRIEIIRQMQTSIDRIKDHTEKNPLADRTEMAAFHRIAEIYLQTGRIQDAAEFAEKARSIARTLHQSEPDDVMRIRNLATVSATSAEAEWRRGRGVDSRTLRADVVALWQQVLAIAERNKDSADEMDRVFARSELTKAYAYLAYDELRLGDGAAALNNYRRSEHQLTLCGVLSHTVTLRRVHYENLVRMGDAEARLGNLDKAESLFRTVLKERQEFADRSPSSATFVKSLSTDIGQSEMYVGDFLHGFRRDSAKALVEYQKCLKRFQDLLAVESDSIDLQQRVAASHYRIGCVTSDPAKARSSFEECLKLRKSLAAIDSTDISSQVEYLGVLARLDRRDEVDRLAERLLSKAGNDPQAMFQIACAFAIMSNGNSPSATLSRNRAFALIGDLMRAGWKDLASIRSDPDMQALHGDPRFARVLNGKLPDTGP